MVALFKNCSKISLLCFGLSCPLSVLASTAFAMSLQPIIDDGLSGNMERFVGTTVTAIIIACIDVLLVYIKNVNKKIVVISYTKNLRTHYFRTFFCQDIARFLEKDSSSYLSKLSVDAGVIAEKYCESILNLYGSLWSLVISLICIASARLELAIYVFFISLVSVNLPKLFQEKADISEKNYLDSASSHISVAQECIRNYLVIRLFDLFSTQMDQYQQTILDVEKKDIVRQKRTFMVDAAASAVSCISFILIIALCMFFVMNGKLSVGYTMSVSQLLGGIMFPLEMLPSYLVTYRTGKRLYRINEKELQKNIEKEGSQKLFLNHRDDHIEINQLSFAYGADHPFILKEITLSLDFTKKYVVLGASGSGKSTLVKIIMGLLEPVCGSISCNSLPLSKIDRKSLYDAIAYQDQNVSFFDDTIKENILLGEQLSDDAWRRIINAACLDDTISKLPDKEFTIIQENGKNISGGEAQRICLARCLARRPKFIIFDEITTSLDLQNAVAIEKAILSLENVGVLHITHQIYEETIRQYDSIFVLRDGRISEYESWDKLIEKEGDFCQRSRTGA